MSKIIIGKNKWPNLASVIASITLSQQKYFKLIMQCFYFLSSQMEHLHIYIYIIDRIIIDHIYILVDLNAQV